MSDEVAAHIGQLSQDRLWRWNGTEWTPVQPATTAQPLPSWARLKLSAESTWWAVAAAILVGLVVDQWLRAGGFGAGATLAFALAAPALVFAARLRRLESRLAAGAAALFAVWLSLRASPWLSWPDLGAGLILLGVAAALAQRGSLLDMGIAEAAARGVNAALHWLAGGVWVTRPIAGVRRRLGAAAPVARGLGIATPIAVLLAALLASADPVFASFLNVNLDLNRLLTDVFFVLAGSLVMAGLLRMAAAEPLGRIEGPAWRLGAVEGLVVLTVLDAIFAAFAVAQAMSAAGAAGNTLRAAGITYADYARSGFFQLLWVAGITLVVLVLFSRITAMNQASSRRAFIVLAEIAIALTLLVVAVASVRLSLYESAYGFTMLRLYSHLFAGWIAVVFLLLAADLGGFLRRRRWFVSATTLTALALLMALNFANPEAVVAQFNIDRAASSGKIDSQYLADLSSDAVPALLASQSKLPPDLWQQIRTVACRGPISYSPSPGAFNWADSDAATARRDNC